MSNTAIVKLWPQSEYVPRRDLSNDIDRLVVRWTYITTYITSTHYFTTSPPLHMASTTPH